MTSSMRQGLSTGLRGLAKFINPVIMLLRRLASSTIISGMVFEGSNLVTFFFKSSAELLIIPSGLRISCEMPAAISPKAESRSALPRRSFNRSRSMARVSIMPSPRFTTKISTTSKAPITTVQVMTTRI